MVVQCGGNDLPTPRNNPVPVEQIAEHIIECGDICRNHGVRDVLIGGVPTRAKNYLQERCVELNVVLKRMCEERNYTFIDNSNINSSHLHNDGVHLSNEGSELLLSNYLFYLNSIFWDRVHAYDS